MRRGWRTASGGTWGWPGARWRAALLERWRLLGHVTGSMEAGLWEKPCRFTSWDQERQSGGGGRLDDLAERPQGMLLCRISREQPVAGTAGCQVTDGPGGIGAGGPLGGPAV